MIRNIYICCFLLSIFFAWVASRSKDKGLSVLCSIISILIPSILGGLRNPGVGTDTLVYGLPNAMEALRANNFLEFAARKEPGYALLCYATMKIFEHVNWVFFMYQLVTVGCFYVGAYKHRKIVSLPLLMFLFLFRHYIFSYNAMRQSMAASIIFMGIDHLENKEYKKFFMYILIAFTFHFSSIAMAIMILGTYIIVTQKSYYRRITIFLLVLLLFFTRPVATAILQMIKFDKYLMYVTAPGEGGKYSLNNTYLSLLVFQVWEYIIFIMYSQGAKRVLGVDNFEYYKFNLIISFMFYHVIRLFFRLSMYTEFINMIAIAALPFIMKDKYLKLLVMLSIIFAYSFRWMRDAGDIETWTYVFTMF